MSPAGSESVPKVSQQPGAAVSSPTPTSVRELVSCFERLNARDDGLRAQIAQMLGREWIPKEPEHAEQVRRPEPAHSDTREIPQPGIPFKPQEQGEPSSPASTSPLLVQRTQRAEDLQLKGAAAPLKPELQAEPLPERERTSPPLLPLLRAVEQRSILATALEMPRSSQEPDILHIIQALTTGQPLRSLPMQSVRTLSRGVQVMRDLSPPLWGFFDDQNQVLEALKTVVGPLLHSLNFFGDPFSAGEGSSHTWQPYQLPPPGVPVLVLSELGQLAGGPEAAEAAARWQAFAARLTGQGSPCMVLTPLKAKDVPLSLRRAFILIEWDRTTRMSGVRQVRREGGSDVSR